MQTSLLDIRTLSFSILVVSALSSAMLLQYGRRHPSFSGISRIGAGLLLGSVGMALLGLRGRVPDALSVLVANAALIGAGDVIFRGIAAFRGQPQPFGRYLSRVSVLGTAIGCALLLWVWPTVSGRIVLFSVATSLWLGLTALTLFRTASTDRSPEAILAHLLFGAMALLFAARAGWTAAQPEVADMMQAGVVHGIVFAIGLTFVLGIAFGAVWEASWLLEERLRQEGRFDPLTGLLNRRALGEFVAQERGRSTRTNLPMAVIMADLDFFKAINDNHGHSVGDEVLCRVAALFREHVREYDAVARYGGEEFVVVLPETNLEQAQAAAEKLRALLHDEAIATAAGPLSVTSSFGVASSGHETPWATLVERADQAVYLAKSGGRNRVCQ